MTLKLYCVIPFCVFSFCVLQKYTEEKEEFSSDILHSSQKGSCDQPSVEGRGAKCASLIIPHQVYFPAKVSKT